MRQFLIVIGAFLLIGCTGADNRPAYEKDLKVFKDKKVQSVFPDEPDKLPIEEVFIGEGIGKKRSYLVENSDSVTFMIVNITTDEYDDATIDNLIQEFKDTYMISDFELVNEDNYEWENYYKAGSPMSDKFFYVKFREGAESKDVFYALTVATDSYPDSAMSMFFLEQTVDSYGY
ncbi:MAG: hypothetical protein ACI9J3_002762 [Parvicellaceae bacterium]|jgi:hypothetical protein